MELPSLIDQVLIMHRDLPLMWAVLIFIVPLSLLPLGGGTMLIGGLMTARASWWPKLWFLVPLEVANIGTAIAIDGHFSYSDDGQSLAVFAAVVLAAIGLAFWFNRKPVLSAAMLAGFCLTYAAAGVLYSALQFLT